MATERLSRRAKEQVASAQVQQFAQERYGHELNQKRARAVIAKLEAQPQSAERDEKIASFRQAVRDADDAIMILETSIEVTEAEAVAHKTAADAEEQGPGRK